MDIFGKSSQSQTKETMNFSDVMKGIPQSKTPVESKGYIYSDISKGTGQSQAEMVNYLESTFSKTASTSNSLFILSYGFKKVSSGTRILKFEISAEHKKAYRETLEGLKLYLINRMKEDKKSFQLNETAIVRSYLLTHRAQWEEEWLRHESLLSGSRVLGFMLAPVEKATILQGQIRDMKKISIGESPALKHRKPFSLYDIFTGPNPKVYSISDTEKDLFEDLFGKIAGLIEMEEEYADEKNSLNDFPALFQVPWKNLWKALYGLPDMGRGKVYKEKKGQIQLWAKQAKEKRDTEKGKDTKEESKK